ncbi:hypothetical protein [Desulfonatronum parangueonense]
MTMNAFKTLAQRINSLKPRERVLLLLVFLAIVGFVGETYYLEPARRELAREQNRIVAQQNRRSELRVKEIELQTRMQVDLDAQNRQRIQDLRMEIVREEEGLRAELDNLVSPTEMTRVLRAFVPADGRLRLESVRSLPTTALDIGASSDVPRLYRRGVELELRGEYIALLRYLRAIEESRWRLHWDVLKINVREHPETRIHLRVYTLSLEPGWIGI